MRWERELASVRGTSPVHKQEGESNAEASLHANARCGSGTLSTSLYVYVGLEVVYNKRGVRDKGYGTGTFKKRKHNKSVHGNERSA